MIDDFRYEKLQEKVQHRGEVLEGVGHSLNTFLGAVTAFDEWYNQVVDVLESAEKLEADEIAAKIEDIAAQRDDRKANFDEMLQTGKLLSAKRDVSDATAIREKIKGIYNQIKQ